MKFQSVDVQGEIHIERVDKRPNWTPADMGRVIYVQEERILYYGTDESWVRSTGFGFRPVFVDDHYTAEDQDLCLVDTRNGPIIITLPPNPKSGAEIKVIDVSGTFESNQCTLHRNGNCIQRLDRNIVLDINDFTGDLIYDRVNKTWKISIEGVAQIVGHATLFVNKYKITAENIDGEGGQKQFTFPFKYNTEKENISVYIDGVKQYDFQKTNVNSITFDESVKAGSIIEVSSIPIESGFNIDRFANITDLENYVPLTQFTPETLLGLIKDVDGHESGLDADLLDGREGKSFVYVEDYEDLDILEKIKNVDGHESGLDADTLDSWQAEQDITKDKTNKIPVTRPDGILDPIWLPFGRGGFEFNRKFSIPGTPTVLDIMDLDHSQGYIIQLNNLTPSTNDVKLYMRFFDEEIQDWTGISYWTANFSNHLSGGLRDFNTNSDMLLADHVCNGTGGLTGLLYLCGFSDIAKDTIRTVRSDITFLSAINSYSSLYQSVGVFNKSPKNYTGLRLYFNIGTFLPFGYVSLMKVNDQN